MELGAAHAPRRLEVDMPQELPAALGDEGRNRQVLANLVTNALKFSPEDGPSRSRSSVEDSVLAVGVTDRGVGIPERTCPGCSSGSRGCRTRARPRRRGQASAYTSAGNWSRRRAGASRPERPGIGSTFRYTLPHT